MTTKTNKPVRTIRDGNLKATIWRNESDKGPFFPVTFSRGFTDDQGQWQDAASFTGTELLRIARLAQLAYTAQANLRAAEKADAEGGDQ